MVAYTYGQFAPDTAKTDPTTTDHIRNVIPTASGYSPMQSLQVYSSALPSMCRGATLVRHTDDTYSVFAGTATNLYKLTGTTWTDVTRAAGGDYNLTEGHAWDWELFGDTLIAVNINDTPQKFDLTSSTNFEALGGNPPNSQFVWQESGYLGLGHLNNAVRTIRRSGLNDAEFWNNGLRGADVQEMADGGAIQGAVGDEAGAFIFSRDKIRRLQNLPGQEVGFSLSDIEPSRGVVAPGSIVRVGSMVFFLSEEGFFQLGSPSTPVGAERIDRFFFDDVNLQSVSQIQGANDEKNKMVWWRYQSHAASGTTSSDRLIGYQWQIGRWAYAEMNLEFILEAATPGYTLEEVESVLGHTDIETIPYSFDSAVFAGSSPSFGAFDTSHRLGFFLGAELEAILDTGDIPVGGENQRIFVRGFRPVGDMPTAYGQVGHKETFGQVEPTWTAESSQNVTGMIPLRASGRTMRFRTRIPAATTWSNIVGIEVPGPARAGKR